MLLALGPAGSVIRADKWLYGQSFAMYGLVEFYRASGRRDALIDATTLFDLIQARMVDHRHGGMIELLKEDFSPMPEGTPTSETGIYHVSGLKSSNAHLHWMEALSELLDVTGRSDVRHALLDVLRNQF